MSDIAIFDLDHTLISVDCSNEWAKYLCDQELVNNPKTFMATKEAYDRAYHAGEVDMLGFCHFILQPLIGHNEGSLQNTLKDFAHFIVKNFTYPEAHQAIKKHAAKGDQILLISASLIDLVRPIGLLLGFDQENIIGVQSVKENGKLTGGVIKPLSFGIGKVHYYQQWLQKQPKIFKQSIFYSDSINDAPLLKLVDQAICVNPDPKLALLAHDNKWEVRSWQQLEIVNS
ncbi:HAD family hydrolase [Cysteiniphilum litorale]|uniref:HAD family hydrolase n=1 Tax=Cysteiniphilum litorale TaxID=2056700 RepID=UPI003F8832CA